MTNRKRMDMTRDLVVDLLKKRLAGKTQWELSQELGISESHLWDILNGKRNPGEKVLRALGLVRRVTTTYVTAEGEDDANR